MGLKRRIIKFLAERGFAIQGLSMYVTLKVEKFKAGQTIPYNVSESRHNKFLIEGMNQIWELVVYSSVAYYQETDARIGVGDDATGENEAQTGLIGASSYKAMDAGYPTHTVDKQCVFKSTFGAAEGNQSWQEYVIDNGAVSGKDLVRIVSNKGTKSLGESWVVTITCILANP